MSYTDLDEDGKRYESENFCVTGWFCLLYCGIQLQVLFFSSPRSTMATTVRRQRPRRLPCWVLMVVLLADLLALSGVYPTREIQKKQIN